MRGVWAPYCVPPARWRYVKWLAAVVVLLPVVPLVAYRPARVLIPTAFGVTCSLHNVCVDDPERFDAAAALLEEARRDLEERWGLRVEAPKIVFCSTTECQETFGLSSKAGLTLGTLGILIAPRGWQRHYVVHELVHYWQAQSFGPLTGLLGEPWLIEGMAYAMSGDPRATMHEPFESYRRQFVALQRQNVGIPLRQWVGELL